MDAKDRQLAEKDQQIALKDQQIARLEAKVQQLQAALAQALERIEELQRTAARQAGPFRRDADKKLPPQKHKKPGRKKGHDGDYRCVPDQIDQVIDLPLTQCPKCGGSVDSVREFEQVIEELPPMRPHVVKLIARRGHCHTCGPVDTPHPLRCSTAGGCAKVQLGPRAGALATLLNKSCGLTMRCTTKVLRTLTGLHLSPGGLSQMMDRLANRCAGDYTQLLKQLRASPAVNSDETSWWVGGPGHWLWTFTNQQTTLYHVASRSSQVVFDILGDAFAGVLVSDCLSVYDPMDWRKHKCFAHHLKAIKQAREKPGVPGVPGGQSAYLDDWVKLFGAANVLWKLHSSLPPPEFAVRRDHLERRRDELLARAVFTPAEISVRDRLIKHREHLLYCLHEPAAEPTNNRAERALRPAVIARKLSCGNKTARGRDTFQTLKSLAVTWEQRDQDPVAEFAQRMRLMPDG